MIKATRVDNTVICFIGNKMYQKTLETEQEILELFEKLVNIDEKNQTETANLKKEFLPELTTKEKEVMDNQEKNNILFEWTNTLKKTTENDSFIIKENKLFMKGIDITVPNFLALEFAKRKDNLKDFKALQNFWRLLALNPDPRCREDLYKFLINNNMTVTPSGYFVAYRNADVKNAVEKELSDFVGIQYTKIKGWKKSPKNYNVYLDSENNYHLFLAKKDTEKIMDLPEHLTVNYLGNLNDLYIKCFKSEETKSVYTDNYTGTFDIEIGKPVQIDKKDCDTNPNKSCSKGLHLGSSNFLKRNYFGSVGLVCLCNPMKVVAVPYTDGQKLRTSEYLPIGLAEYDDNDNVIPLETATFEYDYAEFTENELIEMVDNVSEFEELKIHELPKELKEEDFNFILGNISYLTDEINDRIASIKIKVES